MVSVLVMSGRHCGVMVSVLVMSGRSFVGSFSGHVNPNTIKLIFAVFSDQYT